MKKRPFFLFFYLTSLFVFSSFFTFAQYGGVGLLISAGKIIAKDASVKRKAELAYTYARNTVINSDTVLILRVPREKVKTGASEQVLLVQDRLYKANSDYHAGRVVPLDHIMSDIYAISSLDPDWNVRFYVNEAEAYRRYNQRLEKKEKVGVEENKQNEARSRDSINNIRDKWQKFYFDSLNAQSRKEKRTKDSLAVEQRCQGYYFVNANRVDLKEKPASKSRTLASMGGTSYVKVTSKSINGYIQVEASEFRGYLKEAELVNTIFKINYEGANTDSAKKDYTLLVTETAEQTRYNDKLFQRHKTGSIQ